MNTAQAIFCLRLWHNKYRARAGTDPGRGERHLGDQSATVHRHSLDRLNMINDSLKKNIGRVYHGGYAG